MGSPLTPETVVGSPEPHEAVSLAIGSTAKTDETILGSAAAVGGNEPHRAVQRQPRRRGRQHSERGESAGSESCGRRTKAQGPTSVLHLQLSNRAAASLLARPYLCLVSRPWAARACTPRRAQLRAAS